ncbi:Mu transposase, C-terminal [Propionispira arboris]|uniref:Mu transposase, C-terminal n=1 Tax=Propionispira arboris TaxID=84035 RepID=A0A1H7B1N5_9FIRM|nr:Mu transposase C-terminal domain-containing protein [Propionispira arboris]SEJ71056.1 Mu transposase, C-terminal [Propionispira arboris]
MKKHDLLKEGNNIIRVLEIQPNKILMIDCIKRTMPIWGESSVLDSFSGCTDEVMNHATNFTVTDIENLNADQRKAMYDRYTLIAPMLPFIADERMRSKLIGSTAIEHNISKQTIRNYLCLYLVYINITALVPRQRLDDDGKLTQDEKNMRWALNKFFYTTKKQSLMTAYTMMLKEKYCDCMSILGDIYPSFYQFRYFYRKTKKIQNFYISRDGLKNYQRNNRPLIGDGQSFAPAIGVGMLDATVCDIYLINDAGNLVGRPILTTCIDAYSGLCCGYVLSWAGGVYSLRGLMLNIIADKVAWCKQCGISINAEDWSCNKLPATLVTDMGSEYKSENFEQIAELGVKVINLPSYRPELKGMVEKFFDVVQSTYKKHLKGKGVIELDYQERGVHDYRKDACLTMVDFEKIILHCIIYYNAQRIIEKFPYTESMIVENVKPHASCIWNWGRSQMGANLIEVGAKELILTLLPRVIGKFSRFGLKVNKMRYHCDGYTEQYLNGGEVMVAYNPEDVTSVWLLENGIYTKFTIIESRFEGKDLTAVQSLQTAQRAIARGAKPDNLQAQVGLARHIETITDNVGGSIDVSIKNIRDTRKREQSKHHRDYMKGAKP